jgi:hypothetical protein
VSGRRASRGLADLVSGRRASRGLADLDGRAAANDRDRSVDEPHFEDRLQASPEPARRLVQQAAPASATAPLWLQKLTLLLDDAVRIPGTNLRFGLDAVLGFLIPGAGDVLTGTLGIVWVVIALRRGLPKVVIARMVLNVAIDALLGTIPVLGDVFDIGWKANRRNLQLVEQYRMAPLHQPTTSDYLVVLGAIAAILLVVSLPILIIVVLLGSLLG